VLFPDRSRPEEAKIMQKKWIDTEYNEDYNMVKTEHPATVSGSKNPRETKKDATAGPRSGSWKSLAKSTSLALQISDLANTY
jgi:hypothetical protein